MPLRFHLLFFFSPFPASSSSSLPLLVFLPRARDFYPDPKTGWPAFWRDRGAPGQTPNSIRSDLKKTTTDRIANSRQLSDQRLPQTPTPDRPKRLEATTRGKEGSCVSAIGSCRFSMGSSLILGTCSPPQHKPAQPNNFFQKKPKPPISKVNAGQDSHLSLTCCQVLGAGSPFARSVTS